MILRTELNRRNKIGAAVPVVQYSFGIIDWKISKLEKTDTKIRKLLTIFYFLKQMLKGFTSHEEMEKGA